MTHGADDSSRSGTCLGPFSRAVCLDNCKTSHTLRLLRLTDESLRQRSFEWEPKKSVLKHSLNGSWLCWKNAFHGWVQDKMNRSAERIRSMNSPTCTSRLIEQRDKARRENGDPRA